MRLAFLIDSKTPFLSAEIPLALPRGGVGTKILMMHNNPMRLLLPDAGRPDRSVHLMIGLFVHSYRTTNAGRGCSPAGHCHAGYDDKRHCRLPDTSIADVFLDQMCGIVDIYSIEQGYSFEETQDQTRQIKILACLIFSIIVIAGTILAYRYASVMYYYRSGYRLGQ